MNIPEFSPFDPNFTTNPYPIYDRLRRESPIFFHEEWGLWVLSRYEDIVQILSSKNFGRCPPEAKERGGRGVKDACPMFRKYVMNSFMEKEGPDHMRLRKLLHKVFTPRRIEELRGSIQELTDNLLDQAEAKGGMDFLEDFATPLPVAVIAEMLGVPEEDRHHLRPWSHDIVQLFEFKHDDEDVRRAEAATTAFSSYLIDLAKERLARPREDLMSALVAVEEEGDRLSQDELISTCILLLNAGHEATVNAAGNGMWALFSHPQEFARLRDNPELIPTAVEEMLRYDSPLHLFTRWAQEDVEYQGHLIREGDEVALLYGSANRDPEQFPNADVFDISRRENAHLAFGKGAHFCIGAPLARLELNITFKTLLQRAPDIALDGPAPTYRDSMVFRGLQELRVRF